MSFHKSRINYLSYEANNNEKTTHRNNLQYQRARRRQNVKMDFTEITTMLQIFLRDYVQKRWLQNRTLLIGWDLF